MYVRLGFAVAVNVDPDVLVIDEVLAVGDERFQAKCMDRIRQFQSDGRTILLVSHNADQVRALCDRAIVLDRGQMVANSTAGEGVRVFRERLLGKVASLGVDGVDQHVAVIESITTPTGTFRARTNESFQFDLVVTANAPLEGHFVMELHTPSGQLITRTDVNENDVTLQPGTHTLTVRLPSLPLLDGAYELSVGLVSKEGNDVLAWREQIAVLEVTYAGRGSGLLAVTPEVRFH
jgi:ABC-2 type transport system ATP-binding protein